jgi:hypothetical protein
MLSARQAATAQYVAPELFKLIGLDIDRLVAAGNRSQEVRVRVIPDDRRRCCWIDEHAIGKQSKPLS